MFAVSMPIPMTRARRRTMASGPSLGACLRRSSRAFSICPYLLADKPQALHVTAQLGLGVGRNRPALGRAHVLQALGRFLELGVEVADAEARQGPLHAVDDRG